MKPRGSAASRPMLARWRTAWAISKPASAHLRSKPYFGVPWLVQPDEERAYPRRGGSRRSAAGRYRAHSASQPRHSPDGSRRRSRHHRLADGTSQPAGDGRLSARPARTPASRRAHLADRRTPMKWTYWIELYIRTHCVARGLRPLTLAAYEAALLQFREWVRATRDDRPPDALAARDVLAYLEHLRTVRRNGDSAVNRAVVLLRRFYRAMVAMGHLDFRANP